jgi:DNA polymerase elongation subunit (family B)
VPYLVVQGLHEKNKVKDLVVTVEDFLSNPSYKLNYLYYIKKQINAALGRLFSCFDVDINVKREGLYILLTVFKDWLSDLPKEIAKKDLMRASSQFMKNRETKP